MKCFLDSKLGWILHPTRALLTGVLLTLTSILSSAQELADFSESSFTESYTQAVEFLKENYPLGDWKGINWERAYREYLPAVEAAEQSGDLPAFYRAFMLFAFETIRDGHTSVAPASIEALVALMTIVNEERGGTYGLTVANLSDGSVAVSSIRPGEPAEAAGIEVGDVVQSWNGRHPLHVMREIPAYLNIGSPATDEGLRRAQGVFLGRAPVGEAASLLIQKRSGRLIPITLVAQSNPNNHIADIEQLPDTHPFDDSKSFRSHWLQGGVGYMAVSGLMPELPDDLPPGMLLEEALLVSGMELIDEYRAAFATLVASGMKELIIDLRGNSGGVDLIGAYFMSNLVTNLTFYSQNLVRGIDGDWNVDPEDPFAVAMIIPAEPHFDGRVVVLIDTNTVSAGEGLAHHLKKLPNVQLMGTTRTNGSFAWVGTRIVLPGGLVYGFPGGLSTDENFRILIDTDVDGMGGVHPDILIPVTSELLVRQAQGHDPMLEKAVSHLVDLRTAGDEAVRNAGPTIVAITVDGVVHPTTITSAATRFDPAFSEPFTIQSAVGEIVRIGFVWDWRKEPSSYRILQGVLPKGLKFDGNTGMISGAPETPGVWNVLVSVLDSRGRGYQWLSLVVE